MSEARASIRPWAVVAASLGGAAALHVMLRPALELVPFMLFHGANFISAWYGGLLPGLVCTLSGAVIVNVFFLAPTGEPSLTLAAIVATAVFVAVGAGFSILCHSRLRALRAAEEARIVRENFLTVAAHELRTPLTTLRLRLQRLGARSGRAGAGGGKSACSIGPTGAAGGSACASGGPLGPGPPRACHRPPAPQRVQIRRREAGAHPGRAQWRSRAPLRAGRRHRHRARGPGADLPPVRAGRRGQAVWRARSWAVDRQRVRACARWHHPGRERDGQRRDLHHRSPD